VSAEAPAAALDAGVVARPRLADASLERRLEAVEELLDVTADAVGRAELLAGALWPEAGSAVHETLALVMVRALV